MDYKMDYKKMFWWELIFFLPFLSLIFGKKQNKDQYAMGKLRAQATKNSPYVIQIKQMEKSMKKL